MLGASLVDYSGKKKPQKSEMKLENRICIYLSLILAS